MKDLTKIEIEKNIPVIDAREKMNGMTALLRKLEINDSVVLPLKYRPNVANSSKTLKIKYKTHRIDDKNMRVWRIL